MYFSNLVLLHYHEQCLFRFYGYVGRWVLSETTIIIVTLLSKYTQCSAPPQRSLCTYDKKKKNVLLCSSSCSKKKKKNIHDYCPTRFFSVEELRNRAEQFCFLFLDFLLSPNRLFLFIGLIVTTA